jgi:hypothetical protein
MINGSVNTIIDFTKRLTANRCAFTPYGITPSNKKMAPIIARSTIGIL